jgi:chemotaxis protein MotB
MIKNLYQLSFTILLLASCVPARQVEDIKARKAKCEEELTTLRAASLEQNTKNSELNSQVTQMNRDIGQLKSDTLTLGNNIRRLQQLYNELTNSYDKLNNNNEKLLSSNQNETKKIINQLQMTQEQLQAKEDSLKKMELNLDDISNKLKLREEKVNELQQILASKDSIVGALKKSVSDALIGFANKGLTVEQKNGKVYVSMEERLLFATGSTVVDKEGIDAVKKLARVLESNPDISVLIEGHTDNVPMHGAGEIKDNWDLSVMRATSVVKIITGNSTVNPSRLTAAGRGEFAPVETANTADARKKNRRIEIILTPRLDEIFKVIETN